MHSQGHSPTSARHRRDLTCWQAESTVDLNSPPKLTHPLNLPYITFNQHQAAGEPPAACQGLLPQSSAPP